MVDTVEQQNIRGLDIDKTVKGFALINYTFKNDCTVSSTASDSIRWYQETSADLTATAPSQVANISPLSVFPTLEVSWTRNTSYIRKYAAEGFLSMEDMASADIDVLARTLLRLTRAVVKQVDTRIFNVATDSLAPTQTNHNYFTALSGAWTENSTYGKYGGNPIRDILFAKEHLYSGGYSAEGATVWLNQVGMRCLQDWLISGKGSSIPQFASNQITQGTVLSLLGVNFKVSPNVTTGYAVLLKPQQSITWKSLVDTTSRVIEEPGLGSKIRVWEIGEAIATDPKSIVLISGAYA